MSSKQSNRHKWKERSPADLRLTGGIYFKFFVLQDYSTVYHAQNYLCLRLWEVGSGEENISYQISDQTLFQYHASKQQAYKTQHDFQGCDLKHRPSRRWSMFKGQ